MPPDSSEAAEVEAIFARLRSEVRLSLPTGDIDDALVTTDLPSRRELDRLWFVSGDRPYFARPGRWGRMRGLVLVPVKASARRLVRWYVEPIAADQRAFNAAVVRTIDELTAWTRAELERLGRQPSDAAPDGPEPGP